MIKNIGTLKTFVFIVQSQKGEKGVFKSYREWWDYVV